MFRSVVLRVLKLCLFLVVIVGVGLYLGNKALNSYLDTPLSLASPEQIVVPPGANLTRISKLLAEAEILELPQLLTLYGRLMEKTAIKVGEYNLSVGITPRQLLDLLNSGQVIQYQLTFPEGLNFKEWLALLASQPKLNKTLSGLSGEPLLKELGLEIIHPEGWFFPDTYLYSSGASDRDVLLQAHERMQEILNEEWKGKSKSLPFSTPYEALILASIVEKETGVGSERAQIAGVFVRRLEKGMRLQTDPTVIYGLGDQYQGNITRRHLKQPTKYNTYMIKGLPPTPIAMPGREAIHAALHPAEGRALYFVAKGDGSHYFSATLKEHSQAVKRYQLKRRSNYRSSPNN